MKKTFLMLLAAASLATVFTACKKDEEDETPVSTPETPETPDTTTKDTTGTVVTPVPVEVMEVTANVTADTKWTKDKTYLLKSRVWVTNNATLTIEAGTVIKAAEGTDDNATALIVAKDGKIMAEGTAAMPIIFTAEADANLTRLTDGTLRASTLDPSTNGKWGGLVVIGEASTNYTAEGTIEGIKSTDANIALAKFGTGTSDADNSGVIKYVSIRHGGTQVAAGSEINGLSLYAVGSGTTIEYVEVIGNKDDGIEWWGGTVNTNHLIVVGAGDDGFDYDAGFKGNHQFWLGVQNANSSGDGGEHDSYDGQSDKTKYATPKIYNATYIGVGKKNGIVFKKGAAGEYHNSIFHNWVDGVRIEDDGSTQDSESRLEGGELKIAGAIFSSLSGKGVNVYTKDADTEKTTSHANLDFKVMAVAGLGADSPKPTTASEVSATGTTMTGIVKADYKGAVDPSASTPWYSWTRAYEAKLVK